MTKVEKAGPDVKPSDPITHVPAPVDFVAPVLPVEPLPVSEPIHGPFVAEHNDTVEGENNG